MKGSALMRVNHFSLTRSTYTLDTCANGYCQAVMDRWHRRFLQAFETTADAKVRNAEVALRLARKYYTTRYFNVGQFPYECERCGIRFSRHVGERKCEECRYLKEQTIEPPPEPAKPKATRKPPSPATTKLYRYFDKEGVLLYIGISSRPGSRMQEHITQKSWSNEIADIKLETFDTRKEAEAAEKAAIRTENPKYNVTHNRGKNELD